MTDSEKLDLILNKVGGLEGRFDKLEERFDKLEERVCHLENDIRDIRLILENEIRTNIQRVAEGHLDLSRNLHEAMKPNNEIVMLAVKVSMLETDVRELKRKIS